MSIAPRLLAAALLTALGCGALAQQKATGAPDAPPRAPAAAADLEPSVDTSRLPVDAQPVPQSAPPAPSAAAPLAQAAARPAAAGVADGKAKVGAKDRIELDTTQITGNRELPKVLYIVPWKHSDLSDLGGRPANSLLDEVLAPVDRDVFQRENRYYRALQPDEPHPTGRAAAAAQAAGSASPAADAPAARDEK
jgi:hypothetical protein